MHQSLLNQFRGAYLGAVLGDVLVSGACEPEPDTALPLGAIALAHTKTMLGQSSDPIDPRTVLAGVTRSRLSDMAILLTLGLPSAVFFHDDWSAFQQQLTAQRPAWCPLLADEPPDVLRALEDGAFTIAIALSGILQQCFQPHTVITTLRQTLAYLGRSPSSMDPYLACLETMLNERQPLAIACLMLTQIPFPYPQLHPVLLTVAIALYAALSSLREVALTLRRIQSLQHSNWFSELQDMSKASWADLRRLLGLITGMMVGAYNGLEGIPLAWRHALTPGTYYSDQGALSNYLESYWAVVSEVDVLQLADQVFARWSGADECSYFLTTMPTQAIVSPPVYGRL